MMVIGAMIGSCLIASAQDKGQNPKREIPPEILKEFDKDEDGKLSDNERKAAKEARNAKRKEWRKKALADFDKDGDGKLTGDEQKAARKAHKAAMMKKFDKDNDGKLSEEERAKMPKRGRGRGGKGGKGGKGGPPEESPAE